MPGVPGTPAVTVQSKTNELPVVNPGGKLVTVLAPPIPPGPAIPALAMLRIGPEPPGSSGFFQM